MSETKTVSTSIVKQDSAKSLSSNSVDTTASSSNTTTNSSTKSNERIKICKKKVYLENLEWNVHENMLERFLKKYGPIKRCKIIRDPLTNKSRGCGYVEFDDEKNAEALLIAANGGAALPHVNDTNNNTSEAKLELNMRPVKASFYRERVKLKSHLNENTNNNDERLMEDISSSNGSAASIVNALPYNVLVKIFSHLCLRDRCKAEQGNKKK